MSTSIIKALPYVLALPLLSLSLSLSHLLARSLIRLLTVVSVPLQCTLFHRPFSFRFSPLIPSIDSHVLRLWRIRIVARFKSRMHLITNNQHIQVSRYIFVFSFCLFFLNLKFFKIEDSIHFFEYK